MFDIDSYFKDFVENENIFRDRDVLRPEFIPSILPHRDLQIQRIAEIVACTLKNSMPSNIFIFGKTGTGKTAVVQHVADRLNYQLRKRRGKEATWIFLNCQEVNTGYRVLAKIGGELDPDDPIPISGWPIDVVFDKVVEKLEEQVDGICFIVLDEIDILVNKAKKSHDSLYNLALINNRLSNARVNIIGISNVLTFKSQLDPRVLSSLGEEEIVFPAYNAMELKDILQQRAKIAFLDDILNEDVIPLCAALAAKEHGDARKALDLLRKSGELAERRHSTHVTQHYVYLAQENMEKDKMKEYCEALPLQSKSVLLSIYHLQRSHQDEEIITGEVYNVYSEMTELIPGLSKLTQRRVSELIRELDLAGMINARVKSRGRYGRTKFIKMNIPLENVGSYLEKETQLNDLINYQPASVGKKQNQGMTRFF